MEKIACLFPGIGYTTDKPLLYYSGKMLRNGGWNTIPIAYPGWSADSKGNAGERAEAEQWALAKAEAVLQEIEWERYQDIVFVGKSIGTAVACAYAQKHHVQCRHVLFTPLEETFSWEIGSGIAFHGTADPWAATDVIERLCAEKKIPLYQTEHANHSLETGSLDRDIEEIRKVMGILESFLYQR